METAVPISSLGMLDDMFVEVGKGIVSCECEAVLLNFLRKVGRQEERRIFGGNWNCPFALAPHERLPEILVVPREKTPTGAAARGNP